MQPYFDVKLCLFLWPFVVTYVLVLITFITVEDFIWVVCKLSLLFAVVVQCNIYLTYYKLHGEYSSLKRQLQFSWGIYAAAIGFCFNLLAFVALFGFSAPMKFVGLCFLVLVVLAVGNYVCYVVRVQKFSDEEEAILFVVHVMKGKIF
jgi:hypothetical protein